MLSQAARKRPRVRSRDVNRGLIIDYRCEDGRFLMFVGCVAISNSESLFSSETGVNSGTRSWKNTWLNELYVRKPLVVSISQRSEELRPGLEFDNFKPRLKSCIFKSISWLNGSFFGVLIWVFWKRKSRPVKCRQFRLSTRQLLLCLHIYSLCSVFGTAQAPFFMYLLLKNFRAFWRSVSTLYNFPRLTRGLGCLFPRWHVSVLRLAWIIHALGRVIQFCASPRPSCHRPSVKLEDHTCS